MIDVLLSILLPAGVYKYVCVYICIIMYATMFVHEFHVAGLRNSLSFLVNVCVVHKGQICTQRDGCVYIV